MRKNIISSIAIELHDYLESKPELSYSILAGDLGIVFCLYQISSYLELNLNNDKFLDRVLESLKTSPITYTYCNGISGMGFLLHNLQKNGYIVGADENLKCFDEVIYRWFKESLRSHNIDPLHGALGGLLYFSMRNKNNEDTCKRVLESWCDYLMHNIEETDRGSAVSFRTFNNPSPYNLSISHGLSGLLIITVKALESIDIKDYSKIKSILNQLGTYLVRNLFFNKRRYSCSSSFHYLDNVFYPSRLAWCYGDLGVALALYKLGEYLNNSSFIDTAKKIVIHSSNRRMVSETFMRDRCVCHGSSGVYIIFRYLNQSLFNGELNETVKYWYDYTYGDVSDNIESIREKFSYYDNSERKREVKYGILEGLSGICLGMLDKDDFIDDLLFIK